MRQIGPARFCSSADRGVPICPGASCRAWAVPIWDGEKGCEDTGTGMVHDGR